MKAIRLLVVLTVAVLSSVSGYAYEPLVQEGLVWNTSHEEYEDNGRPYKVIDSWYFDAPVEMYGKTYHPFKHKDYIFGYMRQDGDKVYLLVDGENISGIWYYNENDSRVELSTGDEVLIYDFGAKEGDKYMSVSMDEQGFFYAYPQMVEVCVVKADTVIVNGRERRRQYLSIWSDEQPSGYIAVEGVGINTGTVHLPQYILLAGPGSRVFHFDNMTDSEGNVLFTKADFDAPAYHPLVQEGKAWSQFSYKRFENPDRFSKIWLPEMYFEGKCERNGKEYSVLRTSPDDVLALMRQEGGKVYLLIDENFIGRYNIFDLNDPGTDDPEKYIGKEYLVYDFDAKKGDEFNGIFYCVANDVIYLNMGLEVYDVDEISVNGQNLRRLDIPHCGFVVEGYGAQNGNCLIPQFIECCAGHDHYCDPELKMHHIIDRETREEIFTYEDFSKPSVGVEEIPAEQPSDGVQAKPKDNKMYDLNGREIRNPLPGTVYIQNGEKHVAK